MPGVFLFCIPGALMFAIFLIIKLIQNRLCSVCATKTHLARSQGRWHVRRADGASKRPVFLVIITTLNLPAMIIRLKHDLYCSCECATEGSVEGLVGNMMAVENILFTRACH